METLFVYRRLGFIIIWTATLTACFIEDMQENDRSVENNSRILKYNVRLYFGENILIFFFFVTLFRCLYGSTEAMNQQFDLINLTPIFIDGKKMF